MNNQKGFISPLLLALIALLLVGGAFVYMQNKQTNRSATITPTTQATSTTTVTNTSTGPQGFGEADCHENQKYLIIEQNHTGDVGTDHLVKYKIDANQHLPCAYVVEKGDFEIKNEWAEYFFALENNFLILDSGTGPPPRGLIIYDLTKRAKIFTDSYSRPMVVLNNSIDYWTEILEKATVKNCPELNYYESSGLDVAIDTHVILDLATLTKKDLGEHRCSSRQ